MQEVEGYLGGERDYTKLRGETGPLVYPAGFLYFYSLLYYITRHGKDVRLAQYIFAALYVLTMAFVFAILRRCKKFPTYGMIFMALSKRLHSIYVLRLFNDGVAILIFYISLWCLLNKRFNWCAVWFSVAISIKMNILLFVPALGLIFYQSLGLLQSFRLIMIIVTVQALIGSPFLLTYPHQYLSKAFEFKRVFFYRWTVNWRMLPQEIFLSPKFSTLLTISHLLTLVVFAWTRWCRAFSEEGMIQLLIRGLKSWNRPASKLIAGDLTPDYIVKVFFTSNMIGILFARSLHYQFYCWYAHQLVFLIWLTPYHLLLRLIVMSLMEYSWNVYPATTISSSILLVCNLMVLIGIWLSPNDSLREIDRPSKKSRYFTGRSKNKKS
ncbi:family 58 glycosyltransferase [Phakopsora pachyrhizi]|nr:family 58 glycosyltransferase [Phakopsora pachyrhizi]